MYLFHYTFILFSVRISSFSRDIPKTNEGEIATDRTQDDIAKISHLATRPGSDIRFEHSRCDWQQNSNPACSYAARTHLFLRAHSKASRNCSQRIPIERSVLHVGQISRQISESQQILIGLSEKKKKTLDRKSLRLAFRLFIPR